MIEDLTEECEKCGTIVDIRVPKPDPGVSVEAVFGTGCYGKVRHHHSILSYVDIACHIPRVA